jgi:dTDP-glucose pyrophosphorylase
MQSVILCAGEGSRAGGRGANKCLTEVPGHGAILDYSLKTALALTNGAIVVVGHGADEVRRHVGAFAEANSPRARVSFAEQTVRDGPCGALLCCEAELGGDDFLLFLGDEIITGPTHAKMMENATGSGAAAAGGVSPLVEHQILAFCGYVRAQNVDDVRRTYSLELSGDRVIDIAEKPLNPTNNLMGTGNCLFGNRFLGCVRKYGEDLGGPGKPHFSFPDVLKYAIGRGETVMAHEIGEAYLNFNDAADIAAFLRLTDARGVGRSPRERRRPRVRPTGGSGGESPRGRRPEGVSPLVEHQARDE